MKVSNNNIVVIKELEDEFGKTSEICLSFYEFDDFEKDIRVLNKLELHKFIGALLHIQSKMR